jgi:hypothetical protein
LAQKQARKDNIMKVKNMIGKIGIGSSLAIALAVGVCLAGAVEAQDRPFEKKGGQKLMEFKPIKTVKDVQGLEAGDMIAMSCPKCKTVTVTSVETIKGHIKDEKAVAKHLCPGCETVIKTEGRGKQATDKVVHVCQHCGSKDAFCCVMKKGGNPTKGMEQK